MRLIWHSNAPWCATGYGRQTAIWAPLLRDAGHEVAISAFHGLQGSALPWHDIPVYPGGREAWGLDIITWHYRHWKADLLITLMDSWCLDPAYLSGSGMSMAHWTPVDCEPLGDADRQSLEATGGVPVAISRHGERMLGAAGLKPLYVPHGIDTTVFQPPADRQALRKAMGVDDRFVIGICAANTDQRRKALAEQFQAFARFRRKHPEALLLVHTVADNEQFGGLELRVIAQQLEITEAVRFTEEYKLLAGLVSDEALAVWYGVLDVLSAAACGEGFGLPVIEAQACGTPVIVTRASSMPELAGPGWIVSGDRFWIGLHQAWWTKPHVAEITRAYEQAFLDARNRRKQSRDFALGYDAKTILEKHWMPALESIASK